MNQQIKIINDDLRKNVNELENGKQDKITSLSDISLNSLHVTGNLIVDGSFNINNEIVISTQLDISNEGTGPALKVTQLGRGPDKHVALFNAGEEGDSLLIDSSGNITIYKKLEVIGNVSLNADVSMNTNVDVSGELNVGGQTKVTSLVASSDVSFQSNVDISGRVSIGTSDICTNYILSISGGIYVKGDSAFTQCSLMFDPSDNNDATNKEYVDTNLYMKQDVINDLSSEGFISAGNNIELVKSGDKNIIINVVDSSGITYGNGIFNKSNEAYYYDGGPLAIGTNVISRDYILTISGGLYLAGDSSSNIYTGIFWLKDNSNNLYIEDVNTVGFGIEYTDISFDNKLDISGDVYFRNNLKVDETLRATNLEITNSVVLNDLSVNILMVNDNINASNLQITNSTILNDLSVNTINSSNMQISNDLSVNNLFVNDINIYDKILDLSNNARNSEGSIVNTSYKIYDKFVVSNTAGWNSIDNDINSGFVVSIIPSSSNSKIFINCSMHISVNNNQDSRWWGAKLYRKIGSSEWSEVTGATNNNSLINTSNGPYGTGVFMVSHHQAGINTFIQNLSNSYVDDAYDNTSVHYYTIYWKCQLGSEENNKQIFMNRAKESDDAQRALPVSSLILQEIYYE